MNSDNIVFCSNKNLMGWNEVGKVVSMTLVGYYFITSCTRRIKRIKCIAFQWKGLIHWLPLHTYPHKNYRVRRMWCKMHETVNVASVKKSSDRNQSTLIQWRKLSRALDVAQWTTDTKRDINFSSTFSWKKYTFRLY